MCGNNTYHSVDFFPDSTLGFFNCWEGTYQTNLTLNVGLLRLADIDLASGHALHFFNSLTTYVMRQSDTLRSIVDVTYLFR